MAAGLVDGFDEEDIPLNNELPVVKNEEIFRFHIPKDSYDSTVKQYDTTEDYSVLQYMEGSKWTVNYYNQQLGSSDSGQLLDPANPPVLRPMTKIENFVLYVTSNMAEARYEAMNGEALFYAGDLRPYVGDNFIVPILNKKLGIFQITGVTLKSYVSKSIYNINFEIFIIGDIPESNSFLVNLEQSVNRKFYYDSDFLKGKGGVLLTEEESVRKKKAGDALEYISRNWFREFRDLQSNLLMVKKQPRKYIDTNIEKFFLKQITVDNYHMNPVMANTTYSPFGGSLDKYTIMDLLLSKHMIKLDDVARKVVSLNGSGAIDVDLRGGDLSFMGFDSIIFPYTDDSMLLEINLFTCFSPVDVAEVSNAYTGVDLPDIVDLFTKTKYLFSDNFYDNIRTDLTSIEILLLDYIDEVELDTNLLFNLIDTVNKWSPLQKFFYMPFLYLLVNYYYNNVYSFINL